MLAEKAKMEQDGWRCGILLLFHPSQASNSGKGSLSWPSKEEYFASGARRHNVACHHTLSHFFS
jgi:hypothetical protein